ncbi:MAG: hydrolase [Fimbriimonadales bacterium]|nr:hydrolase [Fimbriimonadales bacterium]
MERSEKLLHREQSVLVVIDMQDRLLSSIKVSSRIAENIVLLLRTAAALDIPVIATTQNAQKLGGVSESIASELANTPPIDKLCFSCAGSEEFIRELQSLGRTQVVLTGIEAHICVLQTALDLMKGGYTVHVPYDVVASRQKREWKYALLRMAHSGVIVTTTESVIYEWLYEAGTDQFRAMLPLLKEREEQRLKAEEDEEEEAEPEDAETDDEENEEPSPTSGTGSEE